MARRMMPGSQPAGPRSKRWPSAGFTLVEILVVVVILGILVTMAQPRVLSTVINAREAVLKQDLFILRDALDQHYADTGKYPASLADLVEKKYLRKVPKDPMTGSAESWVLVLETDDGGGGAGSGVYDVKSGSEKVAVDGTTYGEW